jgi:hypothetical protein
VASLVPKGDTALSELRGPTVESRRDRVDCPRGRLYVSSSYAARTKLASCMTPRLYCEKSARGTSFCSRTMIFSSENLDRVIASSPCHAGTPEAPCSSSKWLRQIGVTSRISTRRTLPCSRRRPTRCCPPRPTSDRACRDSSCAACRSRRVRAPECCSSSAGRSAIRT